MVTFISIVVLIVLIVFIVRRANQADDEVCLGDCEEFSFPSPEIDVLVPAPKKKATKKRTVRKSTK
jgi:hypothetical protein